MNKKRGQKGMRRKAIAFADDAERGK